MKTYQIYTFSLLMIFCSAFSATGNGSEINEVGVITHSSSQAPLDAKERSNNGDRYPVYFEMPQTCERNTVPSLHGYGLLDHSMYIDLPDPIISRVTSALEETLTLKLAREEIRKPLTKTYCQIGVRRMVVDYIHTVDDDSVSHQSLRAVYAWVVEGEAAGWQISKLGRLDLCARRRDRKSGQCR